MALGNKTGGKDFSKGVSGNPNGRPRTPDDIKAIRNFNNDELVRICNELMYLKSSELDKVIENGSEVVIRQIFARILKEAIRMGDYKRIEFVLNRLIGKPKEHDEPKELENYHDIIMQMADELENS